MIDSTERFLLVVSVGHSDLVHASLTYRLFKSLNAPYQEGAQKVHSSGLSASVPALGSSCQSCGGFAVCAALCHPVTASVYSTVTSRT